MSRAHEIVIDNLKEEVQDLEAENANQRAYIYELESEVEELKEDLGTDRS